MKSSNPIQTASVIIPAAVNLAGQNTPGTITSQLAGQVFCCVLATAPFKLQFDTGGPFDCIQGAVIPAGQFNGLTFTNWGNQPVIVQFAVGVEGITFIPTNLLKAWPTYAKGANLQGVSAIIANGTYTSAGSDNGGLNLRKQFTVQNLDNGGLPLEVQDGAGNPMAVIAAQSPIWTLETSAKLVIKNPSGASALFRVIIGETFYS